MTRQITDKLYNVVHFASDNPKAAKLETIQFAVPICLAKWLKRKSEKNTHRGGEVRLVINN